MLHGPAPPPPEILRDDAPAGVRPRQRRADHVALLRFQAPAHGQHVLGARPAPSRDEGRPRRRRLPGRDRAPLRPRHPRDDGADRRGEHPRGGGRRRLGRQRHLDQDAARGREGGHPQRGGRAARDLQAHAPGRSAHRDELEADDPPDVLRARALRSRLRRPPQDQQEAPPRRARAERPAHADGRRHRRHRGDSPPSQDLRRQGADGRHRPSRQPPRPHDGRAAGEPVPHRPRAHGAPHPRADDDPRPELGPALARPPRQLQDVQRGRDGLLRAQPAVAVHGPDESAVGPRAQAASVGPRPRGPVARTRGLRGPRRPLVALRPHLPDRDAGRPEHRPHLVARHLRAGQQVRLHRDALPQGHRRQGDERDRVSRGGHGGAVRDRPGERAAESRPHVRGGEGDVPLQDGVLRQAGARGPVHGRRADAGHLHRGRPHSVPRA